MNKMMQWYPGHMAKAKKEILENLKLVDIVFELLDARIPKSSQNPMLNEILSNKPRLVIITKMMMADDNMTKKWLNYYASNNIMAIVVDSITGFNINRICNNAKEVLKDKLEKDKQRGLKPRPIRAMVVGIPNVGKSTFINKLVNRKVTLTGDKPGITKSQQWIRINNELELLDTPGVLWPKFESEVQSFNLALTGAIKDELIHKDDLVLYFLSFLKDNYPTILKDRYNVSLNDDNLVILEEIAKVRGLTNNKRIDYDRVYDIILNDYKSMRMGRITLDRI